MLNIKWWRRIARKLLFEEVDNKKIISGGCCFNAYITTYLTGTGPCLGDQWVPWATNPQTLAVLSEDLPCSLPFLAYLRWILMQMLFFPWELYFFGANFVGGWAMSWVVTDCCQPSLGFLGWTKFLKNLEGFLSICFPSVLWAGNQSQNSYLAISGSGNSCLLATSFCAVPYKRWPGMSTWPKSSHSRLGRNLWGSQPKGTTSKDSWYCVGNWQLKRILLVSFCSRCAGSQLVSSSRSRGGRIWETVGSVQWPSTRTGNSSPLLLLGQWGQQARELYLNKAPISEYHPGLHKACWYGQGGGFHDWEQRDLSL